MRLCFFLRRKKGIKGLDIIKNSDIMIKKRHFLSYIRTETSENLQNIRENAEWSEYLKRAA